MISFEIEKKSTKSSARVGVLKTPHGEVETPAFVPVATQATIKMLNSSQVKETGSQLLIANTYHLNEKPGADVVASAGGLHDFMNWDKPLMTDSGGFQVFSLGFGQDLGVGKVPVAEVDSKNEVKEGSQPTNIKITDEGVHFKSQLDGRDLFLGPKESIEIQEKLGADIIYVFDECTPPGATKEYIEQSLVKTHRWARQSQDALSSNQALYGIVQGSRYQDLREESAKHLAKLDFPGYGIGGDLGVNKEETAEILRASLPHLPESAPRHMLGIGMLEDFEVIVKEGIDTFDCIVPTHYARHGVAFTDQGKLNFRQSKYLGEFKPIDETCACLACQDYTRAYIGHLVKAKEVTGLSLLTIHNLTYFNNYIAGIREKIKNDLI